MWSILGAILVAACIIGLALWCLILSDEIHTLRGYIERQGFEPMRRNSEMERERTIRADQNKAMRQRIRYLEWMFRKMARGEPVPPGPAITAGMSENGVG